MRAEGFGVEPICAVLTEQGCKIAPRTYRAWKRRAPSARTIADAHVTDALLATAGEPESMYGRRKMTAHLKRQGFEVASCTVHRLMSDEGLAGAVRGKPCRTTIPGKDAARPEDKLNRDFTADWPDQVWVADFTYVRTWAGFVYVAFIIDVYSRMIVGWHVMTSKRTELVTTPLKMALWRRDHEGHPAAEGLIHHSDAGSQYTSIRFADTLLLDGMAASIGSVGDAYDNALAESTIGIYKTEGVSKNSPFLAGPLKTITEVEYATMGWVDWYNNRRLHGSIGLIPPAEYETSYYAQKQAAQPELHHT